MLYTITNLNSGGAAFDIPAHELPPNMWTWVSNARFTDQEISKAYGISLYGNLGVNTVVTGLLAIRSGSTQYWLVCSPTAVKSFDGTTFADITRLSGPYTATSLNPWTGGAFNEILVLNNGVDVPQYWNLPANATKLADLPNWPSTYRAKTLRPFGNHLVALDISINAARYPRLVKTSHLADPGTIPNSWDHTNPAKDAGEYPLSDGNSALIDCLPLGHINVLYTESETFAMQFVGGISKFAFPRRFSQSGILTQGCAVAFGGSQHFVVTQDDIVVHNLSEVNSIAEARVRRWFFDNLNTTAFQITRVIKREADKEIWIVFPYQSGEVLNKALIWNWQRNTWTTRDLPLSRAVGSSLYAPKANLDTFDSASGSIDTDPDTFGDGITDRLTDQTMFAQLTSGNLIRVDPSATTDLGVAFEMLLEKSSSPLKGAEGQLILNAALMGYIRSIQPIGYGDPGATAEFRVGGQNYVKGPINWSAWKTWTVASDQTLDFDLPYRYISIQVRSVNTKQLCLHGLNLDLELTGRF